MIGVVLIEKSARDNAVRTYVPIDKEITKHSQIVWFTRHSDGVWFLNDDREMNGVMREDVFRKVGPDGAIILEALFAMDELVYINLSPKTMVSRSVLVVRKKDWRSWRKIQPRIFTVLAKVGFSRAGFSIDLPSVA